MCYHPWAGLRGFGGSRGGSHICSVASRPPYKNVPFIPYLFYLYNI